LSIVLIRHGETELNATRVMQFPETPLGARGIAQAKAVGQRLATMKLTALVSSDMARAWMTAQAIAATTGLTIEPSQLLHERNFGDLRGRAYDTIGYDPMTSDLIPGGESTAQFKQRVAQAFALIVKRRRQADGPIAIVSHGLVIREIMTSHLQIPASLTAPERLRNTSVTVFEADAPHRAHLLDCAQHLDAAIDDDGRSLSGG
jgi:broad specificity phosphatase PhoE